MGNKGWRSHSDRSRNRLGTRRIFIMRRAAFFVLLFSCCLAQIAFADSKLQIHFMNVGQGDGAVLISPQGKVVLFDNGVNNQCDVLTWPNSASLKSTTSLSVTIKSRASVRSRRLTTIDFLPGVGLHPPLNESKLRIGEVFLMCRPGSSW